VTADRDTQALVEKALSLAAEIRSAEKELIESGWGGYPWEHLGDASKDIHVLMRGLDALAARLEACEQAVRDACVVIERMANGASRAECSPEFERFHAFAFPSGPHARAALDPQEPDGRR
jgi:hypothetical protein